MMTIDSNAKELNKSSQSDTDSNFTDNPYELFSISAIEDELTSRLSSTNEFYVNEKTREIRITWKYLDRAKKLLYCINLYDPAPEFLISSSDIPQKLSDELNHLDEMTKLEVITNVIRRIYESIDPPYFHKNGIYGKIKWRMIA